MCPVSLPILLLPEEVAPALSSLWAPLIPAQHLRVPPTSPGWVLCQSSPSSAPAVLGKRALIAFCFSASPIIKSLLHP